MYMFTSLDCTHSARLSFVRMAGVNASEKEKALFREFACSRVK